MAQGRSILFIVDPLGDLKAYKDSSVAMMRELAARGHDVWACTPAELGWFEGEVRASAHLLAVRADDRDWYEVRESGPHPLPAFDAVLIRKDPPFDNEYLYTTYLLEAARRAGCRVFNDPCALREHNEKFAITEFAEFTAPTIVTRDLEAIRAFARDQGEVVVKPLDGMGGQSIFRLSPGDPNTNVILETITELGTRTIMVQRYLPEIQDGDKRVLLIDGVPVPYALARIPKPGESRGNLAAGGTGRAQPLSDADRAIAEALGPVLAARGLLLVGLDVIGDRLTEVNVTSPTCFVEIAQQTGCNVAGLFVDALERALAR